MPPLCGDAENDCAACDGAALDVTFGTRSYLLASDDNQNCAGVPFGHPTPTDYECVEYSAGAVSLAGKTLSFEVPLEQPIVVNEVAGQTEL